MVSKYLNLLCPPDSGLDFHKKMGTGSPVVSVEILRNGLENTVQYLSTTYLDLVQNDLANMVGSRSSHKNHSQTQDLISSWGSPQMLEANLRLEVAYHCACNSGPAKLHLL